MGPIMLDIGSGRLMDAWEESTTAEVPDYKSANQETCVNENWIKDPPNILFFNLERVKYDKKR